MLEFCDAGVNEDASLFDVQSAQWRTLVAETPLQPHARHVFNDVDSPAATHVRLSIYPDGGVARLRVIGRVIRS
jgi:allantoicase